MQASSASSWRVPVQVASSLFGKTLTWLIEEVLLNLNLIGCTLELVFTQYEYFFILIDVLLIVLWDVIVVVEVDYVISDELW